MPDDAVRGVAACRRRARPDGAGVRGRPAVPLAVVDYAHTPDAVDRRSARCARRTSGRLVVVLGAGGDRDRDKRPLMGAAAARAPTSSSSPTTTPAREDPAAIRAAVLAGAHSVRGRRASRGPRGRRPQGRDPARPSRGARARATRSPSWARDTRRARRSPASCTRSTTARCVAARCCARAVRWHHGDPADARRGRRGHRWPRSTTAPRRRDDGVRRRWSPTPATPRPAACSSPCRASTRTATTSPRPPSTGRRRRRPGRAPGRRPCGRRRRPGARARAARPRGRSTGCLTSVVGVTGSSGKTSTKDLLAPVLAAAGPTVAPAGSFNTEVGVPLTVLRADAATRVPRRRDGRPRRRPHRLPVPDRAAQHRRRAQRRRRRTLGEFGEREAIARAKGELVEALRPDGVAVLNADDPLVRGDGRADRRPGSSRVGRAADADVRAEDVALDAVGRAVFTLVTPRRDRAGHAAAARRAPRRQRARRRRGRPRGWVSTSATSPPRCAGAHRLSRWRMEVASGPTASPSSTTPTTPTRTRCAPR